MDNEFRGSRSGPWWIMLIVGAKSLHSALNTRIRDWIILAEELSEQVYSDGGMCLRPDTKNCKYLQKILISSNLEENVIVWHDVIKNMIRKYLYEKRNHLTTTEFRPK